MRHKKALLALLLLLSASGSSRSAGPVKVLLFPPDNLTRTSLLAWIGEGVAQSVVEQLRVNGVHACGREERVAYIEAEDLPPYAPLSRASMIHVAQHVSADQLVMGSYSGTDQSLRIVFRVLDIKSMKLGGEIVANGPLAALPHMENELAWIVLSNSGLNKSLSREEFKERTRVIPNAAFSAFIQSLTSTEQDSQMKLLQRAVDTYPAFSEAHYLLGRYFYQQGDCPKTIRHLESAGNRRSSYLEDQFIVGNCRLKQSDLVGALRSYTLILAYRHSAQVLNNAAVAHLRLGDITLAVQSLVEARNISKSDPIIGMNLAITRYLQGNQAAAQTLLEELERTHPNRSMVHLLLSLVLSAQGETGKSEEALALARRQGMDPDRVRAEDPKNWTRTFTSLESIGP